MLEDVGYDDVEVVNEFISGATLTGGVPVTGVLDVNLKPARIELEQLMEISEQVTEQIFARTVSSGDIEVDKLLWAKTLEEALGVLFEIDQTGSGVLKVRNTEKRRKELISSIESYLVAGRMTQKEALQLRGRLQFAQAQFFGRIFHHNVVMSPCDKFQCPDDMVREHIKEMARKLHMPSCTSSGKEWSFIQACSSAVQGKIEMHTAWLRADLAANEMVLEPENWVCNLSQTPGFMAPSYKKVPCLLRGSQLFLFKQKRCAMELELLEVQGWRIFDRAAPAGARRWGRCGGILDVVVELWGGWGGALQEELRSCLASLPSSKVRELSGNAMHLHVLTAVIMFALSCSKRALSE
eukprot:s2200_g16.t1